MTRCSPLFVDKLSVTFTLDDEGSRDRISEWFQSEQTDSLDYAVTASTGSQLYHYAKLIRFHQDSNATVLVEFDRRRSARYSAGAQDEDDLETERDVDTAAESDRSRPLRMEFNPSRLKEIPGCYESFLGFVRYWFGSARSSEFYSANITRIDLATDISQLNINDLACCHKNNTVISTIYGRTGSISTIYLGSKNTDTRFAIYDKRAQSRGQVNASQFETEVTRLEVRLKKGLRIHDLRAHRNPFNDLLIVDVDDLEINSRRNSSHYWDWFVAGAKHNGLESTLNKIKNPKTRSAWTRKVIERSPPDWWQPDQLWSGLTHAIDSLELFTPERHIVRHRRE